MNQEDEKREQAIRSIAELMRNNPFTFEYEVKKNPKGMKIIYEVTQEEMDLLVKKMSQS